MNFFDLQKYRCEQYDLERAVRANKLLEERIERLKWQQRSDEYEREQQDIQEHERQQREFENEREWRMNILQRVQGLQDKLEDLKLRRKFGVEEGE